MFKFCRKHFCFFLRVPETLIHPLDLSLIVQIFYLITGHVHEMFFFLFTEEKMPNVICKFKCDLQSPWSANKPHAFFILKSSSSETHKSCACTSRLKNCDRPWVSNDEKTNFFTIVSLWWEFDSVISYVVDKLGLIKLNSASHYQLNIPNRKQIWQYKQNLSLLTRWSLRLVQCWTSFSPKNFKNLLS